MRWVIALLLSISAYGTSCTQATIASTFTRFILGPQCVIGSAPAGSAQEWRDHISVYDSDIQYAEATFPTGTMWAPYKQVSTGSAKVTVTGGSTAMVGSSGATLKTDLCGGGSSPVSDSTNVILEVNTATDGSTAYPYYKVASCTDETHVTLSLAYGPGSASVLPACLSGCDFHYRSDFTTAMNTQVNLGTLTGIVVLTNVATVTTVSAHHLSVGIVVGVENASQSALNSHFVITGTPTSTTFTFATSGVANGTYNNGTLHVFRFASVWSSQAGTPGYDFNPMGEYVLYYRTGDATHLTRAADLADTLWNSPELQAGRCNGNKNGESTCFPPRGINLQGLMVRAVTVPAMWVGLRILRDQGSMNIFVPAVVAPVTATWVYDQRDWAYSTLFFAGGCKGDPDPTEQANWCTKLIDAKTNAWALAYAARSNFMASFFRSDYNSYETSSHVTVTNGSSTVTLTGATWANDYRFGLAGDGKNIMFFDTPGTQPAENTTDVWFMAYVSPTTGQLQNSSGTPVTYVGCIGGCTKGYMMKDNGTGHALAYGTQPFFMGLDVDAWIQAYLALLATGHLSEAATYLSYANLGTQWILDHAASATIGSLYFSQTANCLDGVNNTPDCKNAVGNFEALAWGLELIRALSQDYIITGNAALPTYLTSLTDAMFKNHIGDGSTDCTGASYIYTYDELCIGHGGGDWVLAHSGLQGWKFLGQLMGINGWDWWAAIYTPTTTDRRAASTGRASAEKGR